jgi:hypothetical protein
VLVAPAVGDSLAPPGAGYLPAELGPETAAGVADPGRHRALEVAQLGLHVRVERAGDGAASFTASPRRASLEIAFSVTIAADAQRTTVAGSIAWLCKATCNQPAAPIGPGLARGDVIMRSTVVALALLAMVPPSWAADLLMPNPVLSPAEVVSIQMTALQANDTPETDAGIAQTWAFAHPDNKRVTGPLPRFVQMIKGPLYRILLGHRSHEIKEVSRAGDQADFAVTVTGQTGEVVGYRWSVAKVAEGEHAGAWMTIAVSPPISIGEAI